MCSQDEEWCILLQTWVWTLEAVPLICAGSKAETKQKEPIWQLCPLSHCIPIYPRFTHESVIGSASPFVWQKVTLKDLILWFLESHKHDWLFAWQEYGGEAVHCHNNEVGVLSHVDIHKSKITTPCFHMKPLFFSEGKSKAHVIILDESPWIIPIQEPLDISSK